MLHRSSSSRRRRASRSAASSPQGRPQKPAVQGNTSNSISPASPARRASVAVTPESETLLAPKSPRRSPRHSLAPDLDISPCTSESEGSSPKNITIPVFDRSPRNSLAPDMTGYNKSPRHSLAPDFNRSPRNSLVPDPSCRSPRNSLLLDGSVSPRNTAPLVGFDRSPRHSLAPDVGYGSRLSLNPQDFNRSPRNSIIPEGSDVIDYNRSARNSFAPDMNLNVKDYNRSPRNSIAPDTLNIKDYNRSPRNSIAPDSLNIKDYNRSPRNSIAPDSLNIKDYNRSPRNSIAPDGNLGIKDFNRSPRNSLVPESAAWNQSSGARSPRHSLTPLQTEANRSPRGSMVAEMALSPRGSPRGSSAGLPETARSPRGSLAGISGEQRPRGSLTLTFQDPPSSRRASDDNGQSARGRSSPYQGSQSIGGSRGAQVNAGFSSTDGGSRRASSSVSQASGDEQRRLTGAGGGDNRTQHARGLPSALTTYGSVAYQLKDANMEASGTCDFVCRAMRIVNRTVIVTVLLACLSTLPILMLIMGIQYLRDCPREPHIPVYMLIGGVLGAFKISWLLWSQLAARAPPTTGPRIAAFSLTLILLCWFALGNYWILGIKWPDFEPALFNPNHWCHKTLYVFSIVHLVIVYALLGVIFLVILVLAACQLFGCPWLGPGRFK